MSPVKEESRSQGKTQPHTPDSLGNKGEVRRVFVRDSTGQGQSGPKDKEGQGLNMGKWGWSKASGPMG